jgi:hypothetical protein
LLWEKVKAAKTKNKMQAISCLIIVQNNKLSGVLSYGKNVQ